MRDEVGAVATPMYSDISKLDGKKLGCLTGTVFFDTTDKYIKNTEHIFFNDMTGEIEALRSGKVDALTLDEPVARLLVATDKRFFYYL